MTRLVITPDDYYTKQEHYTFIVYDFETGKLEYIKDKCNELDCKHLEGQGRAPFRPFGIDYDDHYIYIASNDKLGAFDKTSYKFDKLIDVPLFINTHQILKDKDTFYICNTAVDTIGIYNKKINHLSLDKFDLVDHVFEPNDVKSDDTYHVNSLCTYGNKIYFCLHNNNKKMSRYAYFDKDTLEVSVVADAGYCSHGIAILGNKLYSLSSKTGDIVEIDLETKKINYLSCVDPNEIFLRGLDIYNDCIVIGCSNNHNAPINKDNCFISIFDPKNKSIRRYLNINEAFVITDLKLIN
jgi:hypothetical protein